MKLWRRLSGLRRDRSGLAVVELALSLPFLLGLGLVGFEIANLTIVTMRVSRLAEHVADNASRIGDTSALQNRKIYEGDINDLFFGADMQGGERLDFYENGRIILSSLEVTEDEAQSQYIHWQRCKGKLDWKSTYGDEGDGRDGSLDGMGPEDTKVSALPGEAVMFVEVAYRYQPLVSERIVPAKMVQSTSAFTVRVSRDLSQIYQRDPRSPAPRATCDRFDGI